MAQGRLVFSVVAFSVVPPKRLLNSSILLPPTGATDCASQPTACTPVFLFMKSDERETLRIAPRKVSFPGAAASAVKSKSLFGSNWYQIPSADVLVWFKKICINYITVKYLIGRDPKIFLQWIEVFSRERAIFYFCSIWLLSQLYWFLEKFLLRFIVYITSGRSVYIMSYIRDYI